MMRQTDDTPLQGGDATPAACDDWMIGRFTQRPWFPVATMLLSFREFAFIPQETLHENS